MTWLQSKYGSDDKPVKETKGKVHRYLGMILDYSTPGEVKIDMRDYVESMIEDFPEDVCGSDVDTISAGSLFKVDKNSPKLDQRRAEEFHSTVAKGLFASKRARPDIQLCIAFLSTRVKEPTKQDWHKLVRMMKFLCNTKDDVLTLRADALNIIKWFIDAAFAVHPDFKGHTGAVMTMGKGAMIAISKKQKVNTRSSTECELIGSDDVIGKVLWTRNFVEAQGYTCDDNILYRDNKSTMQMELNGKASSGERTRHLSIKHYFITDQVSQGTLRLEYCPTEKMLGDYNTKPLTGAKFKDFRKILMNLK